MPIHELAAIGTATCWALTSLISSGPVSHLGALAFNRLRQVFVALLLAVFVAASGAWSQLSADTILPLALSGLFGIFGGDTLLFATLHRVGPRRSGVLFALNAPITALLGFVVLGESLSPTALFGIALTVAGVLLAIVFGKRRDQLHVWERVKGPLWIGVCLGLGAATCQAVGSILARPVMASGIDPFLASMVRVGVAALCLSALVALPVPAVKPRAPLTPKVAALTALTGFLGLGVGMTLLLFALSGGDVGIVSTLSATSPVIILPMLWARTGERPAGAAWIGAALVVAGMGFIFLS